MHLVDFGKVKFFFFLLNNAKINVLFADYSLFVQVNEQQHLVIISRV